MRGLVVWIACMAPACGRFHFDPLGEVGPSNDANNGGADSGSGSVTYPPTIAECIDPGAPDPAFCRTTNGATELPVDLDDDNLGVPFYSYLRFDFDGAITGREVTAVTLRIVISDGAQSDGPSSGEIWRVATFTATSLQAQAPAQLGSAPIGASQGPVVQLQAVEWVLPVGIIDGGPLCLGIIPITASGVNYWNLQGVSPPQLRIELR